MKAQNSIQKTKYEIDMCNGPLFSKLLLFAIPLIASSILQLLFNAADLVVVGRYSTDQYALGAIGATSALINLFVNFCIGISVGANVVVARYYGAGKKDGVHDAVHTSMLAGTILGFVFGIAGILASRTLLTWMGTPDYIIDSSVLYVSIYFAGMPAMMIFNFGSAILRAVGDTRRPLIFLLISGVVNCILNLIFVLVFKMSVEGVGLATTISQCLSAFLVFMCLIRTSDSYKLIIKDLHIDWKIFSTMLKIGLPAGLQSVIFAASNMLIQSSVNFFGGDAMNGNTACGNIEGFVYTSMNAVYQTNLSFSSQNYGAGNYKRMTKTLVYCLAIVTFIGLLMGNLGTLFGEQLLRIYKPDPLSIQYGMIRMHVIMVTYCLCGIMEVLCGSLRAYGYGFLPMVVSLLGACVFRVIWIYTVFTKWHTLTCLYASYPISWILTITAHAICLIIVANLAVKKSRTI